MSFHVIKVARTRHRNERNNFKIHDMLLIVMNLYACLSMPPPTDHPLSMRRSPSPARTPHRSSSAAAAPIVTTLTHRARAAQPMASSPVAATA